MGWLAWRDGGELVIAPVAGGPARRLPITTRSGDDNTVVWLDDARVMYHVEGNQLWNVVALDSGKITPLSGQHSGVTAWPVVSPDGAQIAVDWNRSPRGLWTIDVASGHEHFVGGTPRSIPFGFSSDGKEIYLGESAEHSEGRELRLARVPVAGGDSRPWLTLPIAGDGKCNFSRDTRRAVCTDDATPADLWLVENLAALTAAARAP